MATWKRVVFSVVLDICHTRPVICSPYRAQGSVNLNPGNKGMDIFAQLRKETILAGQENELPDFLAEQLLSIADNPHLYPDACEDILKIVDMLPLYDTYGQTGYIGMGVSNLILEMAIRRVELKNISKKTT